jgi:hypothetical protein
MLDENMARELSQMLGKQEGVEREIIKTAEETRERHNAKSKAWVIRQALAKYPGLRPFQIALKLGTPARYVRQVVSQQKKDKNPAKMVKFVHVDMRDPKMDRLIDEAKRRYMSATVLVNLLLAAIVEDNLFKALLDD